MKANFVHTSGFRTFVWCVAIYACVFVIANIDNFQAMAVDDGKPAASLSAGEPAPVWQEGQLNAHDDEALADRDYYSTDHTGLLVTVSERAVPMGI